MSCNCLTKIQKLIQQEHGKDAEITNTVSMFNMNSMKQTTRPEPLKYRYHPVNKHGEPKKTWKSVS